MADSATPTDLPGQGDLSKPRTLTYFNGLALVMGLQIGSGIFSSPASVLVAVQSPSVAIIVWLVAGLLVWTGAASFIELGTNIPENGGMQEYLRLSHGDLYGFLFAWAWIAMIKPCSVAMISMIFSEYLYSAIQPGGDSDTWTHKGISLLAVITFTYLNIRGTKVGTSTANVFLLIKVFGLLSMAVIGLAFGILRRPQVDKDVQITHQSIREADSSIISHTDLWHTLGGYADALFAALFAYGGWETIGFVAGELQNPAQTLPNILNHSMMSVISLFLLANSAVYLNVPMKTFEKTNAVAVEFGKVVLGNFGMAMYTGIVCLSCLGALNATIFGAGRLTEAAGRRHYMPSLLGNTAPPRETRSHLEYESSLLNRLKALLVSLCSSFDDAVPVNAIIFNAILSAVFILTGSFRSLLVFKGMLEYLVYLNVVLGIFFLRRKSWFTASSNHPQYYRTTTANCVAFITVSSVIFLRSCLSHPFQVLGIVAFFTTGVVLRNSSWWKRTMNIQS